MPTLVPWREIAPATLDNLIGEFVTRDGTDYGEHETPTATRIEQVRRHLRDGTAVVVYDDVTETVTIINHP